MRTLQILAVWSIFVAIATAEPPKLDVHPVTEVDLRIDKLIEQLGDEDYFVRQWAQEELQRIGLPAFDALSRAETNDDIEIAERSRYLVRLLRVEPILESDPAEVKKILEDYESADEQKRISMADRLSKLDDDKGVPALCRLLRFDRSHQVSKLAALKLIDSSPTDEDRWTARRTLVLEGLGRSPRPAAEWLRQWIATHDDIAAAAAAWSRFVNDETQTLRQLPQQSKPEIVIGLIELQVTALKKLGRDDDALQAMRAVVSLEPEDSAALGEMLAWLARQKAWSLIEEATVTFANRFEQEPLLMYGLAEACRDHGNSTLASEIAGRALSLHEENQRMHLGIAWELRRRGMMEWAEAEFRRTIAIGPPGEEATLFSQGILGEMLHDQGRDFEAAKVYEERVAALEERVNAGRGLDNRDEPGQSRGQMHYFFSCDAAVKKNFELQRSELEKGLKADPTNADVLIGLYRLPNVDEEYRSKTLKAIKVAADKFKADMLQSPESAIAYNQFAWLIANTEGDYNEALRSSQKSLELKPNEGGYLDTLGRCYFALGDLENAVKVQTEAVAQEPHSGLIKRQLDLFRKKLDESKKKG